MTTSVRILPILVFLTALVAPSAGLSAQADATDPKIQKLYARAIDTWLGSWKRGKIEITGTAVMEGKNNSEKDFPSVKFKLQGKEALNVYKDRVNVYGRDVQVDRYSQRDEIRFLCNNMAKADNEAAAESLLKVAAAGLDGKRYSLESGAETVRKAGHDALLALQSAEARELVFSVAKGEHKKLKGPERAAALTTLGLLGGDESIAAMQQVLTDKDASLRLAAVMGLTKAADESSLVPIADLIQKESDTNVLLVGFEALETICKKAGKDVDQDGVRRAVTTIVQRVGSLGDWRAELAAVRFLERARVREAVPALIELLAKFVEKPKLVDKGELSGTLRFEVGRVLRSLSGANYTDDAAQAWRDWWAGVSGTFEVQELKPPSESKTSSAFFGIPVRGNRILFVIDNSGSMDWPTVEKGKDGVRRKGLDLAKRELANVVEQLGEEDKFNVIRFSNGPEAWKRGLVKATPGTKKSFMKFVEGLNADGATNLWGGLQTGLELKSMAHGERFATEVDEVFILSDGAPSAGEIVDPQRIADVLQELNTFSKVRINTIFIHVELPSELRGRVATTPFSMTGEELMKKIAEHNYGRFIAVRS